MSAQKAALLEKRLRVLVQSDGSYLGPLTSALTDSFLASRRKRFFESLFVNPMLEEDGDTKRDGKERGVPRLDARCSPFFASKVFYDATRHNELLEFGFA